MAFPAQSTNKLLPSSAVSGSHPHPTGSIAFSSSSPISASPPLANTSPNSSIGSLGPLSAAQLATTISQPFGQPLSQPSSVSFTDSSYRPNLLLPSHRVGQSIGTDIIGSSSVAPLPVNSSPGPRIPTLSHSRSPSSTMADSSLGKSPLLNFEGTVSTLIPLLFYLKLLFLANVIFHSFFALFVSRHRNRK
ncbi:hypothetical protein V1514DRAFT_295015 [Lipomyces japonicus]|uniref:uncharacterized protein n=1 Tax=Lipomyces japonicus TaxID=56871 RepID=UPI0034CDCB3F